MTKRMTEELLAFLRDSHSTFHAVRLLKEELLRKGYTELREDRPWDLSPGAGYFVIRSGASLLAFRVPEKKPEEAHIAAVHSDSPVFKLKPNPEMAGSGGTIRLNIEKYGGMLTTPWYDRPLTVAGRILAEEGDTIAEHLVWIDRDLLLIPSLAIHMDREANEKGHGNVQTDMLPLFGSVEEMNHAGEENAVSENSRKGMLLRAAAAEAGVSPENVLGADLYLTTRMQPSVWGARGEFISAQRLDDLECCYCIFRGFLESAEILPGLDAAETAAAGNAAETRAAAAAGSEGILPIFCVFDNEEVGSRTGQGAGSDFLSENFGRICAAAGLTPEERQILKARSFMISADNAHAAHPNSPEKADPVNRPAMNGGVVLKHHASQKYATDGVSAAVIRRLCRRHDIPLQDFSNRSDMGSGSTLGNISQTQLSVRCADIGLAQLAMHSCYETAGAEDPAYLKALARYFYAEKLPEVCRG